MEPIAAALTATARRDAVNFYASLRAPAPTPPDAAVSAGHSLATSGAPGQSIPPCAECHGPAPSPKNAAFPRLAGQHERYLEQQLRLLRSGARGGSDYVDLMRAFAGQLTDQQIAAAAAYYGSLTN
jgi:cytochrome c553